MFTPTNNLRIRILTRRLLKIKIKISRPTDKLREIFNKFATNSWLKKILGN
jgi:hypothetical protein